MIRDQREIQRKLRILRHAEETGHVAKICRYFGIGRSSFYRWRQAHAASGEAGLINVPPVPKWHAKRTPPEREEKVVKDIKRATRKQYSSEEKIRIVLDGFGGEDRIAELNIRGAGSRRIITS